MRLEHLQIHQVTKQRVAAFLQSNATLPNPDFIHVLGRFNARRDVKDEPKGKKRTKRNTPFANDITHGWGDERRANEDANMNFQRGNHMERAITPSVSRESLSTTVNGNSDTKWGEQGGYRTEVYDWQNFVNASSGGGYNQWDTIIRINMDRLQ